LSTKDTKSTKDMAAYNFGYFFRVFRAFRGLRFSTNQILKGMFFFGNHIKVKGELFEPCAFHPVFYC